jgi:hypothetical protein
MMVGFAGYGDKLVGEGSGRSRRTSASVIDNGQPWECWHTVRAPNHIQTTVILRNSDSLLVDGIRQACS